MKMSNPKVTIAIPTYNRATFLPESIESVLKQSYDNIEIIISNNDSIDNTEEIINNYPDNRIRYFKQIKNIGMAPNWQFCLEQAKGDFFLLLSDDDVLERDAIKWMVEQLNNDDVALAYTRCLYIDASSKPFKLGLTAPEYETGHNFILNNLLFKRFPLPSATLFRTFTAKKIGGYPLEIETACDFGLAMLIAMDGMVVFNKNPLVKYRVHRNSLSNSDQAISALDKYIHWVEIPLSPQYKYKEEVCKYCLSQLYNIAKVQIIKGNTDNAQKALSSFRKMAKLNCYQEIILLLFRIVYISKLMHIRDIIRTT